MMLATPGTIHEDAYLLLVEQVVAGRGLAGVTRVVAEMLRLPVTVCDEEFEPTYACGPGGQPIADSTMPLQVRARVSFSAGVISQASVPPPVDEVSDGAGGRYVIAPIILPGVLVGYVWTYVDNDLPEVNRLVSHAAAACAVEMVRQQAVMEGELRVRNGFLEELLTGSIGPVNATRRRARFLGYDLRGEQVVFVLDLDRFADYIKRQRLEEDDIQRLKERFRRSVEASLPGVWSRSLIWEHSDSLVVLVPSGKRPERIEERVDAVRRTAEARLSGPTVSAGIGRPCTDLRSLKGAFQEAEHALRIGGAVRGPSSTVAYADLGAHRLLFHLRGHPELRRFCAETLGALERYDREHHGSLLDTLRCYLDLQGNLSQTARVLHLHRNGLVYRLSRIQEITGVDLANSRERLTLQIALLASPLAEDEGLYQTSGGRA